jgi:hypothetical protein
MRRSRQSNQLHCRPQGDTGALTRAKHILGGEIHPTGNLEGGRRAGTGLPGKSEFPASWSDAVALHNMFKGPL